MQMEDHDDHDGRKVWLTEEEAGEFIATAEDTEQRTRSASGCAAGCGARRSSA